MVQGIIYLPIQRRTYLFSCRSSRTNGKRTINKRYTKSEIDYFATFINGKCYIVPVEECSTTKCLRFVESYNNQQECVNYEENYRIERQIELYLNKHLTNKSDGYQFDSDR